MHVAPIALLALVGGLIALMGRSSSTRRIAPPNPTPTPGPYPAPTPAPAPAPAPAPVPLPGPQEVVALVERVAHSYGVDPRVALAFAWLESGLKPNAIGDREWSTRNAGANYRKHVLNNPDLANNPARNDPSAWTAYGLFQLLSPYYVQPNQHPRELLDPELNARKGVAKIRALLRRYNGDLLTVRRAYVGCPPERCGPTTLARVDTRWAKAAERYGLS